MAGAKKDVDFSDEKVKSSFDAVKDSKQEQNFVTYGFEGKSNKLELVGTGSGGLAEMAKTLSEDRVQFCLLRVIGADVQQNVTSNREKFVLFNWIGAKVNVLTRAKVSIQSKVVSAWFSGVSLAATLDVSSVDDLSMEAVSKKLLAAGGAHKPTKYVFGPDQEYDITGLTKA